jgi:tetratricopeptide (TPR) repeat protein
VVRLRSQPVDLLNVDFRLSRLNPEVPARAALLVEPQPLDAPAPSVLPARPQVIAVNDVVSISVTAQQHHVLGRQLAKAARYREAVVELSEAIRVAPNFALAFNARGFALVMLHDWTRAIEDLDQAILLNPSYGNAYQIRAVARRAIGDAAGAASDLKKSQQLAR